MIEKTCPFRRQPGPDGSFFVSHCFAAAYLRRGKRKEAAVNGSLLKKPLRYQPSLGTMISAVLPSAAASRMAAYSSRAEAEA